MKIREIATAMIQATMISRCLRLMKELRTSNREPDKSLSALLILGLFLGIYTRLMSHVENIIPKYLPEYYFESLTDLKVRLNFGFVKISRPLKTAM